MENCVELLVVALLEFGSISTPSGNRQTSRYTDSFEV